MIKKKIRINNIEFRKYNATKTNSPLYEIIKWDLNPHFNKEEEYRKNGYVDSFGGDFLQKEGHSIQKSFFINPEICYVLAFIKKEKESWELRSIGDRLLNLNKEEWNEFYEVYKLGQSKLIKL